MTAQKDKTQTDQYEEGFRQGKGAAYKLVMEKILFDWHVDLDISEDKLARNSYNYAILFSRRSFANEIFELISELSDADQQSTKNQVSQKLEGDTPPDP